MRPTILTFSCPDRPGIVHAISGAIVACGGNILELQQFSSTDTGRFFVRVLTELPTEADFEKQIARVAADFEATWEVHDPSQPTRTLILVSKAGGPLNDLLFRARQGHFPIDVALVMGNHPDLGDLAAFHGVDFEWQPVNAQSKAQFEDRVRQVIVERDIELVVLARYMQIVSPELCAELAGKMINIHHSFLPGFKGANPYRQAHSRGVKLIGATAHFVTSDLDEGPIIQQNVARVDHTHSVPQLTAIGQGLESQTLSQAVRLFAEKRIFLDGVRTVIFE